MKKKKKKRKEEGIQGERRKGKGEKKIFCWLETGLVSSAGRPVCGTGGGGWKDWFHFSPILSHTLHCCSAFSLVPHGPSAPH